MMYPGLCLFPRLEVSMEMEMEPEMELESCAKAACITAIAKRCHTVFELWYKGIPALVL